MFLFCHPEEWLDCIHCCGPSFHNLSQSHIYTLLLQFCLPTCVWWLWFQQIQWGQHVPRAPMGRSKKASSTAVRRATLKQTYFNDLKFHVGNHTKRAPNFECQWERTSFSIQVILRNVAEEQNQVTSSDTKKDQEIFISLSIDQIKGTKDWLEHVSFL